MLKRKKYERVRKRIAVGGICPGCGVSFVCCSLAYAALIEKKGPVSVAELGSPYYYTAFELDSRPGGGPFESFAESIRSRRSVSSVRNELAGINWLARSPREDALSGPETIRAVNGMPEGLSILDCSGMDTELMREVMASSDVQILVIDPRPSRLYGAYDAIGRFRLDHPDGMLLVNGMNPGVHRAELTAFLGTGSWRELPSLPHEYICRAEYSCSPFFEQKKAARIIGQPAVDILRSF